MPIYILLIVHWFLSLFMHSFYLHRYAAHQMFKLSKFWERTFFALTYFCQNVSFLNPRAYALLHRMHHAYSDTEKDPHSPLFYKNPFTMMWNTRNVYLDILENQPEEVKKFEGGYPRFGKFEKFCDSPTSRLLWLGVFIAFYVFFAEHWWQYLFLPLHPLMSPLQGAIVNWFGHKEGYRNYESPDNSKNTSPVDIIMLGELFQNNHHQRPLDPNFAVRWFEIDPTYQVMRLMRRLGMIKYTLTKRERETVLNAEEFTAYAKRHAQLAAQKASSAVTTATLRAEFLASKAARAASVAAHQVGEAAEKLTQPKTAASPA